MKTLLTKTLTTAILLSSFSALAGTGQIGSGSVGQKPVNLETKQVVGLENPKISGEVYRGKESTTLDSFRTNLFPYFAKRDFGTIVIDGKTYSARPGSADTPFDLMAFKEDIQSIGQVLCGQAGESLKAVKHSYVPSMSDGYVVAPVFDATLKVRQYLISELDEAQRKSNHYILYKIEQIECTNSRGAVASQAAKVQLK